MINLQDSPSYTVPKAHGPTASHLIYQSRQLAPSPPDILAMPDQYTALGLSCPSGGTFHVCQDSDVEFLGCCTTDPCSAGGVCPEGDLRNASFSFDQYHDIPPQACSNSNALWYTCQGINPPFMGCCSVNPCSKGMCPEADLYPAKLSSNSASRSVFLTAATSTSTAAPASQSGISLSPGAIAGISIGAVALVLAVIVSCVYIFKRGWYARRKTERASYTKSFIGSLSTDGAAVPSQDFTSYRGEFVVPLEARQSGRTLTARVIDAYRNSTQMTPSLYPPTSPTISGFPHPQSFDHFSKTSPYRSSTFSNSPSHGYEGSHYHARIHSQLSEADPDASRDSVPTTTPNLGHVPELAGPEITHKSRQELEASHLQPAVTLQDRRNVGGVAAPPRRDQNELYIWGGPVGGGAEQRNSRDE